MVEMGDGKRTLTMPWSGLIQMPEKRLFGIGSTSPTTEFGDFLRGKLCSFSIEGPFTDWRKLLSRACFSIQPIHGSCSFRLWGSIVLFQIGCQQVQGSI